MWPLIYVSFMNGSALNKLIFFILKYLGSIVSYKYVFWAIHACIFGSADLKFYRSGSKRGTFIFASVITVVTVP